MGDGKQNNEPYIILRLQITIKCTSGKEKWLNGNCNSTKTLTEGQQQPRMQVRRDQRRRKSKANQDNIKKGKIAPYCGERDR